MSHSRAPLLASAAFCLFALLVTLLPSLGRAQTAAHVVISEVMYDPFGVPPRLMESGSSYSIQHGSHKPGRLDAERQLPAKIPCLPSSWAR